MKTTIRWIIALLIAVFFSSAPISPYSSLPSIPMIEPNLAPFQIMSKSAFSASAPSLVNCPPFFTAGEFTIFKCIDPDDDKLLYSNSVGFISQCTDY